MKRVNKRITPDFVTNLSRCEIFVFGSNLEGRHAGGAARIAHDKFGAVWGQGVGPQGQSYAIPTMHGPLSAIKPYIDKFLEYAKQHPLNRFLLTRIGCGIAGFRDEDMAPLFIEALNIPNISLPKEWIPIMISSPRDCSEKEVETPKVIDEIVLKHLCDEYRYIIGSGVKDTPLPDIYIRYVIDEDRFGYASFGDFFFYGEQLYVFSCDDEWESEHNQGVVIDHFRDECIGRGYARRVIFAGVRTPYKDTNNEHIYTGDVCHIKFRGSEYNFALGTLGSEEDPRYFRYAFVLDNHCLHPEDCIGLTRVGTVFYRLHKEAFPERLNCRCGEFLGLYNYDSNQETEEQRLIMARYTPSFHQKLLQYVVLDEIGAEYKWRGR